MQCRFSFKHMKTSEALIEYAENKLPEKIEKFSTKPIEAHITFSVEGHNHIAHCSVKGGDGFNFEVESKCEDMYGSVDLLIDKLIPQLRKRKEKLKNHKFSENLKSMQTIEPVSKDDPDNVPVDANDLLKFEEAKRKANG